MSVPELKPCPFCGGAARHDRHASGNPVVICHNQQCAAMVMGITPADAARVWNVRPLSPEDLVSPTYSNARYWTQRVMDVAYEDRHYDDNVERVIRELLEKDTEMAANDQARAVLDDIFELVDGYADGTADATSYDRLCAVIADKCRPFINPLNPPNP